MAKQTEPRLGVTRGWLLGESGQTGVADPLNKNWRLVATLTQTAVKSITATAPPGSPADGDIYIIPASATGAWAGKTNQIAAWDTSLTGGAGWFYVVPSDGFMANLVGGGLYKFDGTNWTLFSGGGGGGGATTLAINAQTGTTYTLVTGDFPSTGDTLVEMNNASANTLTVPTNASVAIGVGRRVLVRQEGAGQTTIAPAGGVTITGAGNLKTRKQGSIVALIKRATDTWEVDGDAEITTLVTTGQTSLGGAAGAEGLRVLNTASAVNRVEVMGATSATLNPSIYAEGSGANLDLVVKQKGTGQLQLGVGTGSTVINADSVILAKMTSGNYVQAYGGAAGFSVRLQALGADSNIPLELWAKGTSRVDLRSSAYMTGDFTFVGNSRKLQGDFSTSTLVNRTLAQSSTSNGATDFGVVPNGSSTTASVTTYNNATPTNSAYGSLSASSTVVKLDSGIAGSGTQLPLDLAIAGSTKFRVGTAGQLGIGGATYGNAGDVMTSGGAGAAPSWQAAPPGFRNKIINGDFSIWQRGTSQTANGYGSDDRWLNSVVGSTHVVSRQTSTLGSSPSQYYARTVVTSVAGAGNLVAKGQSIEDVRLLAGQTVTISFDAWADTNRNIALELVQRFGSGGSPSADVTAIGSQLVAITSTRTRYSVTVAVPSITGKTIGTDNASSTALFFWLDAGSTYNARTAGLGQQSGTFNFADVQVELGSVATPFERRPPQVELALCQRYYQVLPGCAPAATVGGLIANMQFVTAMRLPPTATVYSTTTNTPNGIRNAVTAVQHVASSAIQYNLTQNGMQIFFDPVSWTPALTVGGYYDYTMVLDAEL
jgi:hypothetical protein